MELRTLRAFVEVIRQGGFSQAAKVLYTTQPNISKSVKLLEEEVGSTLLNRDGHQQVLTEAGKIVFDRALNILAQRDDLLSELDELKGLKRGTLRLGLPPIGSDILFAPMFAAYQKCYPNIEVHFIEHGGTHLKDLLQAGEIDVAGTLLPVSSEIFDWKEIQREPIDALISIDHPLAKRKSIDLNELGGMPFIMFEEKFALNPIVRNACLKNGFTPKVIARSNQIAFVLELISLGMGVGFLPRMIAQQRQHSGVKRLKINNNAMEWRMALLWRRDSHLSYAAQAWIDLFGGVNNNKE